MKESIFYHIYPIGFCGAPKENDFSSPVTERLNKIYEWIPHFKELGINAIYLGPLFSSTGHGYDTADFYQVDRRLGSNETLKNIIDALHREGIKVILDGVFHHTGRDFWAFRDVINNRENSQYCNWFSGLSFDRRSPYNDPFTYDTWNGHYNLVKLNLNHCDVKNHIYYAVKFWVDEFHIDGLRLDAADCMDINFLREFSDFCHGLRENFFMAGEVIHGDYRKWIEEGHLDSVTNYECYKGLYSSHNDKNYFEIAFSLNREYCDEYGLYKNLPLYNFVDNHDVDRVASTLNNQSHLYTLYAILFTMPGIPSIYYGSEWGMEGKKTNGSDDALRPCIDLQEVKFWKHAGLFWYISSLARIRRNSPALCYGNYEQLHVNHEQLAFSRKSGDETVIVSINSSDKSSSFDLNVKHGNKLIDLLNEGDCFDINSNKARFDINPYGARIMVVK